MLNIKSETPVKEEFASKLYERFQTFARMREGKTQNENFHSTSKKDLAL
jgi:hypothetical protein